MKAARAVNVLIDTSIWSAALRRRSKPAGSREAVQERHLRELIAQGLAIMIGPVRQELLSGIDEEAFFERLRVRLGAFSDLPLETADFEMAAQCANRCRRAGLAGALTDFQVCAVALRRNLAIFTADRDFQRFARILPLTFYTPA
ncbi:MAG: PIN domain-containing protein [Planctomycetota bacterium]